MAKIVKNVPAQRKTTEGQAAPPGPVKSAKPNPATPPKESKVKADPSAPCCPYPKWMKYAWEEFKKDVREDRPGNDPNIMKYHGLNEVMIPGHPDQRYRATEQTAWCGAFVNWCLAQAGYGKELRARVPERALAWERVTPADGWWPGGLRIGATPIYGAIGTRMIKTKKGDQAHVTFVVGKDPHDPGYIHCLGGNQGDKLQVTRYDLQRFRYFLVPKDYPYQCCGLDLWTKESSDNQATR